MELGEVLVKRVFKDTKTIALLDEFEEIDDARNKIYDTLYIPNMFFIMYDHCMYSIGMYLQRKLKNVTLIDSTLTFTKLKKKMLEKLFFETERHNNVIINEVFNGINKTNIEETDEFYHYFECPILFKAQNSLNKSGYGNRFYNGEMVYEGTLYGETSEYMFIGVHYQKL